MEFGATLPAVTEKTPGDLFVVAGPPPELYWLKPGAETAVTDRNRVQVVAQGDPGAAFEAWEDGFSAAATPENHRNFLGSLVRRQQRPAAANQYRYSIYLRTSMLANLGINAAHDNGVKFYATVRGAVRAFKRLDGASGRYSHEVIYRGEQYAEFETDLIAGLPGFTRGTTYSVLLWKDAAATRAIDYKPARRQAAAAWELVSGRGHVGRLIAKLALPTAPGVAGTQITVPWRIETAFGVDWTTSQGGVLDLPRCLPDGQPGVVVRTKVGGVVTSCFSLPWSMSPASGGRSHQSPLAIQWFSLPTSNDRTRRNVTLECQTNFTTQSKNRMLTWSGGDPLAANTVVEVLELLA